MMANAMVVRIKEKPTLVAVLINIFRFSKRLVIKAITGPATAHHNGFITIDPSG